MKELVRHTEEKIVQKLFHIAPLVVFESNFLNQIYRESSSHEYENGQILIAKGKGGEEYKPSYRHPVYRINGYEKNKKGDYVYKVSEWEDVVKKGKKVLDRESKELLRNKSELSLNKFHLEYYYQPVPSNTDPESAFEIYPNIKKFKKTLANITIR